MNKIPKNNTGNEVHNLIAKLNEKPEEVCRHLFPDGKVVGNSFCIGSLDGEPGESLKVCLHGANVGVWKDWASDQKGGAHLLDFWGRARKLNTHNAIEQVTAWLRESDPSFDAGNAAQLPKAPRATSSEKPFDWATCLRKTSPRHLNTIAGERGYSYEYTSWLFEHGLMGFSGDRVAFPIHNATGEIVGAHIRKSGGGWQVAGGCRMCPLVVGDLKSAKMIDVFESQWDCFAIYDKLTLHKDPSHAAIITRGAANGKFVTGLIPPSVAVYVFKQNDQTKNGRNAADGWLEEVARHAGAPVHLVTTPAAHKDVNDWTRAGATAVDIQRAISAATPVAVPEPAQQDARSSNTRRSSEAELPEVFYDHARKIYLMQNNRGGYIEAGTTSIRRLLRSLGYSVKGDEGAALSPLDAALLRIEQEHDLAYAGPVAGYKTGLHEIQDNRILVTSSPKIITPAQGEWPVLSKFLDGLIGHDGQQAYFFGWIKFAVEALRSGKRRPGQALALAGERDCGKSLLQNLITELLGGRSAKPHQFMTGATSFNKDLFGAEHLMVEDEIASTDFRSRRNFGSVIKQLTVNETQRLHAKFRDAITLTPFWRLTISVNSEPEALLILPPIDNGVEDKLILLEARKAPMPMPGETDEERALFWNTLTGELPAFLHWLQTTWSLPENLRLQRYGVTHFHHPAILRALNNLAPETQLLQLIDEAVFTFVLARGSWEGKARELEKKLLDDPETARATRNLLSFNTALGTYLARLESKHPDRVSSRVSKGYRYWTINPPKCDDEDATAQGD